MAKLFLSSFHHTLLSGSLKQDNKPYEHALRYLPPKEGLATNRPFPQDRNAQQGPPPSPPLEHPCPQSYTLSSTFRSAYVSLHTSTQRLPQHDWPYLSPHPSPLTQHAGKTTFFAANPGPYSTDHGAVVYRSLGKLPQCLSCSKLLCFVCHYALMPSIQTPYLI